MSNLTPAAIASTLATIGKEIDELTSQLITAEYEALQLRREYRRLNAKAMLKYGTNAEGKTNLVATRDALALEDVDDILFAWETAQVKVKAIEDELRAKRERLKIGQSIGALLRAEWNAS